jgi:hypothetical protein
MKEGSAPFTLRNSPRQLLQDLKMKDCHNQVCPAIPLNVDLFVPSGLAPAISRLAGIRRRNNAGESVCLLSFNMPLSMARRFALADLT